jgi:hypothetical protein
MAVSVTLPVLLISWDDLGVEYTLIRRNDISFEDFRGTPTSLLGGGSGIPGKNF